MRLQDRACQEHAIATAGVDVDAVGPCQARPDLGLPMRRMAVHDDAPEIAVEVQEVLANVDEVERRLQMQGIAGPDAGMDEQVGTRVEVERHGPQKRDMFRTDPAVDGYGHFLKT